MVKLTLVTVVKATTDTCSKLVWFIEVAIKWSDSCYNFEVRDILYKNL